MKHVIIGTAGHVDHGKTTLIRALTGTNTDRLKEEQERGMTIDLGFAALRLPDGTVAGIVDVPGHERFLKNMLAGATGVDVVLLVVASDEGVMPQTVEHLDILRLLDVRNGVIALTKMDAVDRDWADAVEEDLHERLKETFLAKAPVIRVSATTGKGIDALKRALLSAVSRSEARNASLPFRVPIDRTFTRPGFGTVVTGTLVAGTLRTGDAVEIVPQGIQTRVRGLQVHGQKVSEALAGSRVAVNLAGVDTDAIERGAQLAAPGAIRPTERFDATLRLLPDIARPLKDRARVRVHLGTAEVIGRIRLLDAGTELAEGESGYVQFQGETTFACTRGDRFVVRAYSPMETVGGGIVLDPAPAKHRKGDADILTALAARESGSAEDVLLAQLERSPYGLLRKELAVATSMPQPELARSLDTLANSGDVVLTHGDRWFHPTVLAGLTDRGMEALAAYHRQYPLRSGMPKEEVRAALGRDVDPRALSSLLDHWQSTGKIFVEGAAVRLADFRVSLNERQQELLERIAEVYRSNGVMTPALDEVCRAAKAPPDAVTALLRVGVEQGRFVRVSDGVYYARETVEEMKTLVTRLAKSGPITVAAFRDATQSNRKFSLQALEYLDSIRFTRRNGDEREVVGSL